MDTKGEKVDVSDRSTNSVPLAELGEVYDYPNEVGGHHGELRWTFKARHIQMICLGGCIGSGIFISTGKVRIFIHSQEGHKLTCKIQALRYGNY